MTDEPVNADATPAAPLGGGGAPRKELEGFRVTRTAPPEPSGPPVGMIVALVLVLLGVGFGVVKMNSSDDPGTGTDTSTTDPGGTPTQVPTDTAQADDVEIPDFVLERLEFLEGEGNVDAALTYAEEQMEEWPNARLRAKIASYRKELGIDAVDLSPEQLLQRAQAELAQGKVDAAIGYLDEAIDGDPENAQLYVARGKAKARNADKLGATGDYESALELGYEPVAEIEALLEKLK